MGGKKSKALALDLIDELLHDGEAYVEIVKDSASNSDESERAEPFAPQGDHTVDIGSTEVSPGTEGGGQATDFNPTATVAAEDNGDHTMKIKSPKQSGGGGGDNEDRVRASVGRFGNFRSSGQASSTEAALAQSESLRIAQQRISDLEGEVERLRVQNEELAAAGETLRRRTDELLAQNQKRESDYNQAIDKFDQQKEILTDSKEALQRDLELQRRKAEELEMRISANIQKIRGRERQLENRLELLKAENAALVRSKDEMILELKRNIDQLNLELNNYRAKNQELNRQTIDKQEMLRRTVKALRLALSMLEGEEEAGKPAPQRKAK